MVDRPKVAFYVNYPKIGSKGKLNYTYEKEFIYKEGSEGYNG